MKGCRVVSFRFRSSVTSRFKYGIENFEAWRRITSTCHVVLTFGVKRRLSSD